MTSGGKIIGARGMRECLRPARAAALTDLIAEVPPAALASLLGLHPAPQRGRQPCDDVLAVHVAVQQQHLDQCAGAGGVAAARALRAAAHQASRTAVKRVFQARRLG